MARYDVFPNPDGAGYLLDVQADLLDRLSNRIVVPLLPIDQAPKPASRLNPQFEIKGGAYIMVTQFLAAVPLSVLESPVRNLSDQHIEITNALDMVFQGF